MIFRRIIIPVVVAMYMMSPGVSSAQNISRAREAMDLFQYSEATTILKQIVEKGGKDQNEATLLLADCYKAMNQSIPAEEWYSRAAQLPVTDTNVFFNYGLVLRENSKYQQAGEQFRKYAALKPSDPRGTILADYCSRMAEWERQPDKWTVANVSSLNTESSDFSPVLYNGGIVLCSDRPTPSVGDKTYGWTGLNYLDLYTATLKNGDLTPPVYYEPALMSSTLNQVFHDGPASFLQDGSKIYFTRTVTKDPVKDKKSQTRTYILKIYSSSKNNENNWMIPEPFLYNSEEYSVGHPALSPDGRSLYFVSDMPGGLGGKDIYMCRLEGDKWSEPQNIGSRVNTWGDEMFPYVDPSGNLYFASTGHMGYGGLDLFRTSFKDGAWVEPENLMAPMNSSTDDFGILITGEKPLTGLFSSNRLKGAGRDDIWSFTEKPLETYISGKVLSCKSGKDMKVLPETCKTPLAGATLFVLNKTTGMVQVINTDAQGTYRFKGEPDGVYAIKAAKDGFVADGLTIRLGKRSLRNPDLRLGQYEIGQVFTIDKIYYDLDKSDIREDAKPELNKLVAFMKENPITVELSSHTDSRASDAYNLKLSQRRAESATKYITSMGIDPGRIVAKGYGEQQLLNKCGNDIKCTEAEHQLNRRTEFKITGLTQEKPPVYKAIEKFRPGTSYDSSLFESDFFVDCPEKAGEEID